MLERRRRQNVTDVTFVLAPDPGCGAVSVVGDFNSWTPGVHTFGTREDGSRAVTVGIAGTGRFAFRYLADGGHWFDDEAADWHDGRNCYLDLAVSGIARAPRPRPGRAVGGLSVIR